MNYQQARQRKSDNRWHFTNMRDDVSTPLGYCAEPSSPCCQGAHDTAEEAAECYKRYLLDKRLNLNMGKSDSMNRCRVCGDWTKDIAGINGSVAWLYELCDRHRTREDVSTVMGPIRQIVSS